MLSNENAGDESESTILGPFYRENPPVLPAGASIVQMNFDGQETALVEGVIRDSKGAPISGVMMDVWEDASNGLYCELACKVTHLDGNWCLK